jgi:hypothetical protein
LSIPGIPSIPSFFSFSCAPAGARKIENDASIPRKITENGRIRTFLLERSPLNARMDRENCVPPLEAETQQISTELDIVGAVF